MQDLDIARTREVTGSLAGPLADPDAAALDRVRVRLDARPAMRAGDGRRWAWLVAVPATAVAVSAGLVAAIMLRPAVEAAAPQQPAASPSVIGPTLAGAYVAPLQADCPIADLAGPRWESVSPGGGSAHEGTDLACPTGTPFYAVHAGTVTRSEYETRYGMHVFLDIGDGVTIIYAHAATLAVHAGDTVDAGDLLGYVGATGNARGPHLHLEVRVQGVFYDTVTFLREHGVDVASSGGQWQTPSAVLEPEA